MNPLDTIHISWSQLVLPLLSSDEKVTLLKNEILPNCKYYPEKKDIFKAFSEPKNNFNVVLLGQDPYPNPLDAVGLSFVNGNNKTPASLRIIYEELEKEGFKDVNIHNWYNQGVLLLNTALTVESGKAGSHLNYWKGFTSKFIQQFSIDKPCIWILWGKHAQNYIPYIHNPFIIKNYSLETIKDIPITPYYNYILTSAHPAAETYTGGKAGFYNNNHFIYTNIILELLKKKQIQW